MTTKASFSFLIDAAHILSAAEAPGAVSELARTLRCDAMQFSRDLTATTIPAVSGGPAYQNVTLGASDTVIDLTAAPLLAGVDADNDMTGLRVVLYAIKAADTNAGDITVGPHSADGYNLGGSANDLVLKPGQVMIGFFYDKASALPQVASGVKNVAIGGTEGDNVEVLFLLGT